MIKSKDEWLKQICKIAKSKGGVCLSFEYRNAHSRLKFRCAEGHEWLAIPDSVLRGSWCKKCSLNRVTKKKVLDRFEFIKKLIFKKNGECLTLSTEDLKNIKVKCEYGHIWQTKIQNLADGKWCHVCAKNKKFTIEDVHKVAQDHHGKLISKTYVNARSPLEWECKIGHRWKTQLAAIRNNGTWCPYCAGKAKKDLNHCKELAHKHRGYCLSSEYKSINTKMLWKCEAGHEWMAKTLKIQNGQWCPKCAIKKNADAKRSSIEDMQKVAKERFGKCISTVYVSNFQHLEWECIVGHRWKAKPGNILTGTWCPDCSPFTSERICRAFFEAIFNEKFPRSYPVWLRTKDGNKLELDGYCEMKSIAFEHQGEQHYSQGRQFSKSRSDLNKRLSYDKLKKELCKTNKVVLIEIPALNSRLQIDELENYIFNELDKNKINIQVSRPVKIDWKKVYTPDDVERFDKLQQVATLNEGKLLSLIYSGMKAKYKWECKNGHIWEAVADSVINQKSWCAQCAGKAKLTIEDLQRAAKAKGGKLLSSKYIDANHKYSWVCKKGHQWEASAKNIIKRTWCPICGRKTTWEKRRLNGLNGLKKNS